jgi:hypothetical protein
MDTGAPIQKTLSDEVSGLSDTIRVCERLCLLSARTLLRSTVSLNEKAGTKAPLAFIPSISRDLQNALPTSSRDKETTSNPHPTTTAHCVTALQGLLPVIGRFQLGTHESKGLAFHPIDRETAGTFTPKAMSDEIRQIINNALRSLDLTEAVSGAQRSPVSTPPNQPVPEQSDEKKPTTGRSHSTFPPMHPFRAAQVLRAIAPSHDMFRPIAWKSLFAVVWFLNRRSGSLRGFPSIQATDSPGTAFLTSKCVEAIETVLSVFERRRKRFRQLFELMSELQNIVEAQKELKTFENNGLISEPLFHHGYRHRTAILIPEIRACINELACDSALPATYHAWNSHLASLATAPNNHSRTKQHDGAADLSHAEYEKRFKTAEAFLLEVVSSFRAAMNDDGAQMERARTRSTIATVVETFEETVEIVTSIHLAVRGEREVSRLDGGRQAAAASADSSKLITLDSLKKLPRWICSEDYWIATKRKLGLEPDPESTKAGGEAFLNTLELHWARHKEAAENALKTVVAFADYVRKILDDFEFLRNRIPSHPKLDSVTAFLGKAAEATRYLIRLRRQLSNDLDIGVRWAEVVMNRHLAYAASGTMALFDPSELAHAVRVMCRDTGRVRFALILKALQVVSTAQRADGTWSCQQPFYWRDTGFALWTMSLETVSALVSTVQMLVINPERYGTGPTEVTAELRPIYDALDRFFRWLSGSLVSLRAPLALPSATASMPHNASLQEQTLYGWCSDRLPESERIHSWATAIAIEFLVEFRRLTQERINALLRTEFLSHSSSELTKLSEVEPTDLRSVLGRNEAAPVIARLMKLLRQHKHLELVEGPWIPSSPHDPKISFWSVLLYGPPGTSKTFLAKAIAAELSWPLISISPSDFLAKGDANIEVRAQEIFSSFSAGSRLVFLFDEIDELIRDRKGNKDQRSALSFLTPSFLTKLQDFRDAAEKNEFIFILATNYKDRIDAAAIRSGRIDQLLPIVYPDSASRAFIIIRHLVQRARKKGIGEQFKHASDYLNDIKACLQAAKMPGPHEKFLDNLAEFSGFLSYQKIRALLKLLPGGDFKDQEKRERELRQLIQELSAIGKKEAGRYQPEINLTEYAERPAAFEEILLLADVIPRSKFPWPLPREEKQPLLQRQLDSLHDKIGSEKEFPEFKGEVAKLIRSASKASATPARRRRFRQ